MFKIRLIKYFFSLFFINSLKATLEPVNNNNTWPQLQQRPDWLRTCPRHNPNEKKCFQHLFQNCFPILATGLPDIGVNSFEPLRIDQIWISKGSGKLLLLGSFQNLIVHGPSNATVKTASLDLNAKHLNFKLDIPLLRIQSEYNIKGNILLLPLIGNGEANLFLKNIRTAVYTNISLLELPEEIVNIDDLKVTFNVDSMHIHLSNLFNGNEILADSLNFFLNENNNEIIEELKPDLERGLVNIFLELWNNFFHKLPTKLWLI